MRRAVRIVLLLALLAVPSIAVASSSRTLAINCGRKEYKPREIIMTCVDGGQLVDQLKWSSWTRTKAVATGSYVDNTCSPTCAESHPITRPVQVTLSGRGYCPGQSGHVFGYVRFAFPKGAPPHAFHHFAFVCPP